MTQEPPTGTITLCFTDIEGSTQLWERLGDGFRPVLDRHNELIRALIGRWGGYEVKSQGDSFMVAFPCAHEAVRCALEVQVCLAHERWPEEVGEIRIRIGMHTGEPIVGSDPGGRVDYFGPMVNRAARVSAAGHGGQTLISSATREAIAGREPAVEFIDLGVHRLRGLEEPEHLFEVRHPELPAREFPPLKTLDSARSNLPSHVSPFVGREEEAARLGRILARPETRLLTLVGFGGMGKTRLALQLAERAVHHFPDGAWWIELEEVRTGQGMLERIAFALRIPLQPQPSVTDQLLGYLSTRSLLLVLDNVEQIPDAARGIAAVLQAAPGVRVLATSRRALEAPGEQLLEIQPLPPHDAQALFIERARARRPDFEPTPEIAADVAELCRRLEGVPLAIELAASRIVGMTPREISSRLNARFRLLQTRSPDLPDRQRALRGAIDWSFDLLSEDDRRLFAQLSVFSGGFTLEDAEAVCDGFDVFESVLELRKQSLLRTETNEQTQQTRYVMLESVREYAAERLAESGNEAEAVHRRHAKHFCRFGEGRAGQMRTRREKQALAELSASLDNLRAALDWAAGAGEAELAARLTIASYQVLYRRGLWDEAGRLLARAPALLAAAPGDLRALGASLLLYTAHLEFDRGQMAAAREHAEACLALRGALGDAPGRVEALNLIALVEMEERRPDAAAALLAEAQSLLAPDDHWRRGIVLHNRSRLAQQEGNAEAAAALYHQALEHRRAAGDARGEAETLGNIGVQAHLAGRLEEAKERYLEGLALHSDLGDRHGIGVMLHNLGELAEADGDVIRALCFFLHAERMFRELESAHAGAPSASISRLLEGLDPLEAEALLDRARRTEWESYVADR